MWMKFWVNDFVQHSKDLDHCTFKEGCDNVIQLQNVDELVFTNYDPPIDIFCGCGNLTCYRCKLVAHEPVSCAVYKKWSQKLTTDVDELKSIEWEMRNTKKCPNAACQIPIQKNAGCMHMTCRKCGHHWCWLCEAVWENHGNYYDCENKQQILINDRKAGSQVANVTRDIMFLDRSKEQNTSGWLTIKLLNKFEKNIEFFLHQCSDNSDTTKDILKKSLDFYR
jgi:hypothetical protein